MRTERDKMLAGELHGQRRFDSDPAVDYTSATSKVSQPTGERHQ